MTCPEGLLVKWRRNHSKMGIMRSITTTIDLHYPGLLGPVILTNAPWAVHAILQILRPVLPARISQKVEVVPVFQTAGRLCELIDPLRLPKFLGGDGADEDFVPNRAALVEAASGDKGTELHIPAGKSEERGIWLSQGGIAAYGFSVLGTASQDIVFSCRFEAEAAAGVPGPAAVEVRAPTRVREATGGGFVAPGRGRLVMVFDNSYSWVKPKCVRYECSQLPPEAADAAGGGSAVEPGGT